MNQKRGCEIIAIFLSLPDLQVEEENQREQEIQIEKFVDLMPGTELSSSSL